MYYYGTYENQNYHPTNTMYYRQFPSFPQSEQMAYPFKKDMMYPQLKESTLNSIMPFVNYGLEEGKSTSYKHAMTEVAAMSYLIGKGMDPQTAYLTVESWEVNEKYY